MTNTHYRTKICEKCGEQFGSTGSPKYCYTCKDKMYFERAQKFQKLQKERKKKGVSE